MTAASSDYLESLYKEALVGGAAEEDALFEALTARFRLITANRIWDRQDALDVAQEAAVTVHQKYRAEGVLPSFTGWAHRVMHNKVLEYYRSASRRAARTVPLEATEHAAAATDSDPDLDRKLRDCLRQLIGFNPRYGRILVTAYQGYSSGEICDRLALTKSNYYTTLSRARSLLKQCLEGGDAAS